MTVAELKAELAKYDDTLNVGGSDDMGYIEHIHMVALHQIGQDEPFVNLDIERGWREPNAS